MDHGYIHGRRIQVGLSRLTMIVACCLVLLPTRSSDAGLFDWFCRRKPQQTTTYYATTAAAKPAATQGCCGAGYCEQTVLKYQPQVAYRTVWQPVPVTTYKRTVSYNPTTGLPITCTQPCTTYTYQARRVPYTTYRPYYTTEPVTIPGNCPVPSTTTSTVAVAPAASSCACSNAGTPTAGAPYYSTPTGTPAASAPSTSTPGATPWTRVQPESGTSPYNVPSPTPATGDPADQRPGIPPSTQPPNIESDLGARSIRGYPNSPDRTAMTNTNSSNSSAAQIDDYYRQRLGRIPQSQATSTQSSQSTPLSRTRGFDTLSAPRNQPSARTEGSSTRLHGVRPLPNLDFGPAKELQTPKLLNETRDRTAAYIQPIPTRWASNQIQWPQRRVSYQSPVRERNEVRLPFEREQPRRAAPQRRLDRDRWEAERQESSSRPRERVQPTPTKPRTKKPLYRFDSESNEGRPYTGSGWRSLSGR